ncbi:SH3 domain-containing protein [Devosia salina]
MRALTRLVLLGLALAGGSWSTSSMSAEATASVNVRSGPGVQYPVLDTLSPGETVDIDHCVNSGWCYVLKSGPDGWVSGRYLTNEDALTSGTAPRPDVSLSFSIEGFSFSFGDGGFSIDPAPSSSTARVCFYEDVNFRGDGFCLRPGQNLRSLGDWNDEISSIDVRAGAEALVCEHVRYAGRCVLVSRDIRDLGRRGNDQISSIKVR